MVPQVVSEVSGPGTGAEEPSSPVVQRKAELDKVMTGPRGPVVHGPVVPWPRGPVAPATTRPVKPNWAGRLILACGQRLQRLTYLSCNYVYL